MDPANNAPPMIGEILFYEHSNCIKREPEDIEFFNEGIIENTHTGSNEVKEIPNKNKSPNADLVSEAIDDELPKSPKAELVGEAIDDKLPKKELVGEAVDFDCGLAEDSKEFQANNCMSTVLGKPPKENEEVNISLYVNSPNRFQNDKDFFIQQTNSESLLLYKCNMCPNPHFFQRNYLENQDKAHGHGPPSTSENNKTPLKFYKCEVSGCEYKTSHKNRFNNHTIVHSEKKYKCDECEFTTKSEKYLGNHKNAIHNPNSQRFFCKQCSYNSISKINFRQHEMVHKDPELRETYKCHFEGCTVETKSKKTLYRHARVHKDPSEMISLKCPSCSYETIFKRDFQKHLSNHNRNKTIMYCFNCSYKTVSKMLLRYHMVTHTRVEALEMFKCSQCSYTSKRKGNLLQHMVKHTDVEMLKCFSCAFETKRKHTLRNHMDTHKKS